MAARVAYVFAIAMLAAPATAVASADDATRSFLEHVQRGDFERAKRMLEQPRYRSQPRGGDDAYFVYESGFEPNLAFLVGHTFVPGTAAIRMRRSDWYLLDGTMYATVTIPLRFAADARPWLLPPASAFGRRMRLADFMSFVAAPERYPQNLTLRLRPGVGPGRLRPLASRSVVTPSAAPSASTVTSSAGGDSYGSVLGPWPVDPVAVILPSGESLDPEEFQRLLPRLATISMELSLLRRGRFASWRVSSWQFGDAVVVTQTGDVTIGR